MFRAGRVCVLSLVVINMTSPGSTTSVTSIASAASASKDSATNSGRLCEVRMRGGVVRGSRVPGEDYYAFLGIPYGAPPTGELRFKAPQPAARWRGVLDANTSRLCVQPRHSGGTEDCLTLDVFAPSRPADSLATVDLQPVENGFIAAERTVRPVLVYIHGGGFLYNDRPITAEAVAPLIQLGIIVVTINYRMGVLGFLSLGTEEVPGNAGFRDQILALQWVRDNIGAFGGDNTRVTISGTSAGSASAHYLAMSPAADRLFQRVICMDGTALTGKFIVTYPLTNARKFAKLLGFENENVTQLTKFYKQVSSDAIRNQSLNFFNFDNGELGFGPCVERSFPGFGPVVARAPQLLLARNARPMLLTYSDDEGSMRASDLIKNQYKYNTDFPAFMPGNLDFPSLGVKYAEANNTRKFYFGNRTISAELAEKFSNFWGDKDFVYPAVFTASEHVKSGFAAHLLEFTYVGGLSVAKAAPAAAGAGHGDVLNYLLPPRAVSRHDSHDLGVVDTITTIVANFVKTGSASWAAAAPGALARLRVRRSGDAAPVLGPVPAPVALWDRLYRLYRRADYTRLTQL